MKRTLALLTSAALVATPVAAQAATKRKPVPTKRVQTFDYKGFVGATTPGGAVALNGTVCSTGDCYDLQTLKYEKQVAVDAGGKVALQYYFDGDYKGTVKTLCGTATIPVAKGTVVTFRVVVDPTCQGVPTQGTVTLTVTGVK